MGLIFCLSCSNRGKDVPEEGQVQTKASATRPPNLIFIMVDDMGYGDLGVYGQKLIQTPAMDQLALEGMRFTNCYAGAPVCAPSRSVLMTGLHSGHTKIRGNFSALEVPELPLPRRIPLGKEDITLAEILKEAGYVNGIFGKWGLGEATTTGEPNAKGFDAWMGFNNQRRAHSHYPEYLWNNQDTLFIEKNQKDQKGQHSHELFTQYALNFLEKNRDTTFFLYLPYCLPHSQFSATPEYLAKYTDQPWSEQEKTYAAMINMIDADVGILIQKLREYGVEENTLVLLCSDNGAANRYEGVFDSSGPLKGRKRDMYEGGIRTPMIAWMPGTVPAGEVSDYPWYFPDVLPTFAEIAGVESPEGIDGMSVLALLKGNVMPESDRFMYWEFHEKGFDQAVRWKNWKVVRRGVNGSLELYDLSQDESESKDVASENPEILKQFENYLANARTKSIYWPIGQAAPEN